MSLLCDAAEHRAAEFIVARDHGGKESKKAWGDAYQKVRVKCSQVCNFDVKKSVRHGFPCKTLDDAVRAPEL